MSKPMNTETKRPVAMYFAGAIERWEITCGKCGGTHGIEIAQPLRASSEDIVIVAAERRRWTYRYEDCEVWRCPTCAIDERKAARD